MHPALEIAQLLVRPEWNSFLGLGLRPKVLGKMLSVPAESQELNHQLVGVPSETSEAERFFLFNFFATMWPGKGNVIEIGPFLGGTSRAIAMGMQRNPQRDPATKLHTYDRFGGYADSAFFLKFLEPLFAAGTLDHSLKRKLETSEGLPAFLEIFEAIHSPHSYNSLISVEDGVLPDLPGGDTQESIARFDHLGPVGAVFVDGCKSWYATKYFMKTIIGQCAPGTCFIFQDYGWFTCFWLPVFRKVFGDWFHPVCHIDCTYTFQLGKPLSAEIIEQHFPDEPEVFGKALLDQIFTALLVEVAEQNDVRGIVYTMLQHCGALAYIGEKPAARALHQQVRSLPYAGLYRETIDKAAQYPTYRPNEGVTLD